MLLFDKISRKFYMKSLNNDLVSSRMNLFFLKLM